MTMRVLLSGPSIFPTAQCRKGEKKGICPWETERGSPKPCSPTKLGRGIRPLSRCISQIGKGWPLEGWLQTRARREWYPRYVLDLMPRPQHPEGFEEEVELNRHQRKGK
jgi:hypothetical protein